jgi:hypothetical protein
MRIVEVSTEPFEVGLQATSFHFSAVTEGPSVGHMHCETVHAQCFYLHDLACTHR